jgi:hypothetical protein
LRRAATLLFLGAVVPLCRSTDARAQDVPDIRLPFNPYLNARVGDWCVYQGKITVDGEPQPPFVNIGRVERVGVDSGVMVVTRSDIPLGSRTEHSSYAFSLRQSPQVAQACGLALVTSLSCSPPIVEDRVLFGQRFPAVRFTLRALAEGKNHDVVAWVSSMCGNIGLLTFHESLVDSWREKASAKIEFDFTLLGFGSARSTSWGFSAEEYFPVQASGMDPRTVALPVSLGALRPGDWVQYVEKRATRVGESLADRSIVLTVSSVDSSNVTILRTVSDDRGLLEKSEQTHSRYRPPRVTDILTTYGSEISNLRIDHGPVGEGGRDFYCLRFRFFESGNGFSGERAVYFSDQVPSVGIVATRVEFAKADKVDFVSSFGIRGFGSRDHADFGKLPPLSLREPR